MVVPQKLIMGLTLDLARPIIYVVDPNSASDLFALQKACSKVRLPDPCSPIELHRESLSAVIYLYD